MRNIAMPPCSKDVCLSCSRTACRWSWMRRSIAVHPTVMMFVCVAVLLPKGEGVGWWGAQLCCPTVMMFVCVAVSQPEGESWIMRSIAMALCRITMFVCVAVLLPEGEGAGWWGVQLCRPAGTSVSCWDRQLWVQVKPTATVTSNVAFVGGVLFLVVVPV